MTARAPAWPLLAAALAACAGAHPAPDRSVRQVQRAMAQELAARGDWGAAFQAADALVTADPDDRQARLLRAQALRRQGAAAEAEADLLRVLADAPGDATAHDELALLCEATGRPGPAMEHHREALRLAPGSARAANNLAFALVARGKPAEAIPVLETALKEHPADPRLRNNLGFAYAATGDFTRAARQFDLAGTPAQARHNLGLAYERGRNLPRAYDLYLEAARLDAGQLASRAGLASVARALGRPLPPEAAEPATAVKGAP